MARKKLKSSYNYPLIFGLLFLFIFSVWRYHQARILSFNSNFINEVSATGVNPVHIKSYPLGIDVGIKNASIKDGVWAIDPKNANFLINSAGIGGNGNTIIYGHNNNEILGPLRWINVGAKIEVLGSDGKTYNYEVTKIDTVDPDNLEYIKEKNEETLTIYTCVGFLDSKRFIAVAKRIK